MKIEFQGKIKREDFVIAYKSNRGKIFAVSKVFSWIFLFLFVLGFSFLYIYKPFTLRTYQIIPLLIPIIFISSTLWSEALQLFLIQKNAQLYEESISGYIDENCIESRTSRIETKLLWSAFMKYRRVGNLILLYQRKNLYNIIPRSFFATEDDWNVFLSFLDSRFPSNPLR
jgi:hypothetical protein